MKKIYLLILFSCLACVGRAQVSAYIFSQSFNPYTTITGTSAITGSWDDQIVTGIPINFTYNFNGTNYTQCFIDANGYIGFGNAYSTLTGVIQYHTNAGVIAGINADLHNSTSGPHDIIYNTIGLAPNRVFVVQWTNCQRYLSYSYGYPDTINFQIRLYESTNVAEVMYGNCNFSASANGFGLTAQVGLGGAVTSDFNDRSATGLWSASTAGGSNAATCALTNTSFPTNGLTFDWRGCYLSATPTNSSPACQGANVTLNGIVSGGAISYSWAGPGGFTSTLQNPTTTVAGVYTLTAVAFPGCTVTGTTNVVLVAYPTSTIAAQSAITFCQGGSVMLSSNTGNSYTYQWQQNGGNILNATNSVYTATTSGSYDVIVTNTTNCSTTSSVTVVTVNPLPAAGITPAGSTTLCAGNSVVLNANTGAGLTYQWQRNGNNLPATNVASYTASVAGTYTVVETNSTNCSATSAPVVVVVNPVPQATATTNMPTTFCQGSSIVLQGNTGTGITYQWQQNGGNIGGATTLTYTTSTSGTYDIFVTNAFNCSAPSNSIVVTVIPPPAATITAAGATSFCSGGNVTLNADTGAGFTYQWLLNNVTIPNTNSSSYSATASGSYSVIVFNANGCSATSNIIPVTVNSFPAATITAAGPTTFCQGGGVTLNANTGNGYHYNWQIDGVNTGVADTNSSYTATISDNFNVVVTNAAGCSSSSNIIHVTATPAPQVSVYPIGSTVLCQGDNVTLLASAANGVNFQWQQNGGNLPGATNNTYVANAPGSYHVVASDTGSCTTTSPNIVITVFPKPQAVISQGPAGAICIGDTLSLNANTGTGYHYQWLQNNTPVYGATSSSYLAYSQGAYTVAELTGSNCTDTSVATFVTVNPLPVPVITATGKTLDAGQYVSYQWYFNGVPIGGATNEIYTAAQNGGYTVEVINSNGCKGMSIMKIVSNVGVANVLNVHNNISIYPNPTNGSFTVSGTLQSNDNKVQIQITDLSGKVLMQEAFTITNGLIDKQMNMDAAMPAGMYLIKLLSDSETSVIPFVKQ